MAPAKLSSPRKLAWVGAFTPSEGQLAKYAAIDDDGVVVAGQLTDDEIITAALGVADEATDEDPYDVLLPMRHTAKEATDALVVLEEFYYDVPGNTLALEGLSHARKLVVPAQLSSKTQTSTTDVLTLKRPQGS